MNVTEENFNKFKKAYNKAVRENKTQFDFGDSTVLIDYAKYLIQYVETKMLEKKGHNHAT